VSGADLDALRERFARSPYHRWSSISLDDIEHGRVVLRLELQPEHLNPQGIVHGGVIAGLLDSVCGMSLRSILPEDRTHRTVQLSISFLRASVTGTLIGTGTAVHEGRRVGYAEGEVRDEAGKLVAKATATFINLPEA
jgi:uncharacterized protein (TIGR00369 family)